MRRIVMFLLMCGLCLAATGRIDKYGLVDVTEDVEELSRLNSVQGKTVFGIPSDKIRTAFPISSRSAVTESETQDRYTMGTDSVNHLMSTAGYKLLTKDTLITTSSARFTIPAAGLNFRNQHGMVHVLIYVSCGNSFTGTDSDMPIRIRFAHDVGYANYWEVAAVADKTSGNYNIFTAETGWVLLSFPYGAGKTGGSWDYSSDVLYFLFETANNTTTDMAVGDYITIDSVFTTDSFVPYGGGIVLMFDDARASLYDSGVHQLAADRNIKLVIPTYADMLGRTSAASVEHMTSAELAEFVRLGHQVIVHSDTSLSGKSEDDQYKIMKSEQQDLIDWANEQNVDIGDGYLYFVANANDYDENTIAAAKRLFKMFFPTKNTPGGTAPDNIVGFGIPQDRYRIPRVSIGSSFDTNEMASMFASAAGDNSYIVCYAHDIGATGDYSTADFTTILDGIVSNKHRVLTCTDLSEAYNTAQAYKVSHKTAAYAVLPQESGTVFTNSGDTDSLTFTLPPAVAGLSYTFVDVEGDATEDIIVDPKSISVAVGGVSTLAKTFTVAGNYVSALPAGYVFTVSGSTGNDGNYIVERAKYDGSNTVITTTTTVSNSTADGTISYSDLVILAGAALDPGDKVIADNDEGSDVPVDAIRFDCYQNGTWTTTTLSGTWDDNGA